MAHYKVKPRRGPQRGFDFPQPKIYRIKRRDKLGGGLLFPKPEHNAPHFDSFRACVEWAVKNKISLEGADLTNPCDGLLDDKDLSLAGGNYDGGKFRDVLMTGIKWCNSSLVGADFSGSHNEAEIKQSNYKLHTTEGEGCDFSGCDLSHGKFDNAMLNHSRFLTHWDKTSGEEVPCLLYGTSFVHAEMQSSRFSKAETDQQTNFTEAYLSQSNFHGMDLQVVIGFPVKNRSSFMDCKLPFQVDIEQQERQRRFGL